MAELTVELNSAGIRDLLRSAEMQSLVESRAKEIAGRCGKGYEVSTYVGTNRVNASVRTTTKEAREDNMKNNTILKALK